MKESAGGVLLPEPDGIRRGMITFKGGIQIAIEDDPEQLADKVREFLNGDGVFLELQDAQYGEKCFVPRLALVEAIMIGTTWLKAGLRQNANGKIITPSKYLGN